MRVPFSLSYQSISTSNEQRNEIQVNTKHQLLKYF